MHAPMRWHYSYSINDPQTRLITRTDRCINFINFTTVSRSFVPINIHDCFNQHRPLWVYSFFIIPFSLSFLSFGYLERDGRGYVGCDKIVIELCYKTFYGSKRDPFHWLVKVWISQITTFANEECNILCFRALINLAKWLASFLFNWRHFIESAVLTLGCQE